jgi:hypothetical protein
MSSLPIEFFWALDPDGRPTPIGAAQRRGHYTCPLCQTAMIVKKGEQVRHHFAHEHITECDAEGVNRAALRRILAISLREHIALNHPIPTDWLCRYCGNQHQADLLRGSQTVIERAAVKNLFVDLALQQADKSVSGLILLYSQVGLDDLRETLRLRLPHFEDAHKLMLPVGLLGQSYPSTQQVRAWLQGAEVFGAPCAVLEKASQLQRDPQQTLALLLAALGKEKSFVAAIEQQEGLADTVSVGGVRVWLPADQWREVVGGGLINNMGSGLQIISQLWPQPDQSVIRAYYVSLRGSKAIALRRYSPREDTTAAIDEKYRLRNTLAIDVAKMLVQNAQ